MLRFPLLVCVLLLGACGNASSSGTPPPTAASATATPTAQPTPTPVPEVQRVDVVKAGVGSYMLEAVPVAILKNVATRHTATGVKTHFTVSSGGRSPQKLEGQVISLSPGETLAVAAQCTDTCNGADTVDVQVEVGGWAPGARTTLATSAVAFACGSGCAGSTYGKVTGVVTGTLAANTGVYVVADCTDGSGTIIGGNSTLTQWAGGASQPVEVNVLLRAPAARCELFAAVA